MARSFRRLVPALVLNAALILSVTVGRTPVGDGARLVPAGKAVVEEPDVVVWGGTPAGVAAAIGAAQHRSQVVLVAEGGTVGGMMSSGISASDIGSAAAVQGVARTFFDRVRSYYGGRSEWRVEPRIAERILVRMLSEAGVDVRLDQSLLGVRMAGRRIACLQLSAGDLCAPNYVDASYTGDVLAAAGVPHRLGMADLRSYGESMALRRDWRAVLRVGRDQWTNAGNAFRANPYVLVEPTLPPYRTAYRRGTPSLTYRLCVTSDPARRVPFTQPAGSDHLLASFRVMARAANPNVDRKSNGTIVSDFYTLAQIPGGKYDLNAGWSSLSNVPAPPEYFRSRADREAANEVLRTYIQAFFWFVQNDPTVPSGVRTTFRPFGLCADEFTDNGNWPYQPYVREGRRIAGRHTLTVGDIYINRQKTDAVAVGSYHVDAKSSQYVFAEGVLHRDVGAFSSAPVYEIPFRAMVPTTGSVTNLLAPVGLSASPTAYGSVRMEPQYMALGQAAGIAADQVSDIALSVAALPAARVQAILRYDGVAHTATAVCAQTPAALRRSGGFSSTCSLLRVLPD